MPKLRILFIGDYKGVHASLARELRRRGHSVELLSDSPEATIPLPLPRGFFGSTRYLYRILDLLPRLSGFDVVQLANPEFFDLKPGRLSYLFERLAETNKRITLSLLKPDWFFIDAATRSDLLRFSYLRNGRDKTLYARTVPEAEFELQRSDRRDFTKGIYSLLHGFVAFVPELYISAEKFCGDRLVKAPIPIDSRASETPLRASENPLAIAAIGNVSADLQYGRSELILAAEKLAEEMAGKCEKALRGDGRCDIALDSSCRYSPSKEALEAMAQGIVAVGGAQPEYLDFIGAAQEESPIICAEPGNRDSVKEELRRLVSNPQLYEHQSQRSRMFIEKYHNPELAAEACEKLWNKILQE